MSVRAALIAAGLLAAAGGQAQTRSFYYEATTTRTLDRRTQTGTSKVWVKTPMIVRKEDAVNGHRTITIIRGSDVWLVDPAQRKGMHTRVTPAQVAALQRSLASPGDEVAQFIRQGGRKDGQQVIGGTRCDRYRFTDRNGWVNTLWVIPGPDRLRRRQETSGTTKLAIGMGQGMGLRRIHSVTDFTNWQVGKPMSDSLFQVPAGVKVTEAPARPALPAGHPGVRGMQALPPGHPSMGPPGGPRKR